MTVLLAVSGAHSLVEVSQPSCSLSTHRTWLNVVNLENRDVEGIAAAVQHCCFIHCILHVGTGDPFLTFCLKVSLRIVTDAV